MNVDQTPPRCRRGAALLASGFLLLFLRSGPVFADGALPPLPYRYIHPPPALAGENRPPTSVIRVFPAGYWRALRTWSIFTPDGQAGISGSKGAFVLRSTASAVVFRIDPVTAPAGLPSNVVVDGNAYRYSAFEQPGNLPARQVRRVLVTMRWPHLPTAIFVFRGGSWQRLCSADTAVLSSSTIGCLSTGPGTYAVVTPPSNSAVHLPATPLSRSPYAWINRYIPLFAALAVIILSVIAGYFVTRPDRPSGSSRRKR